LSGECFILFFIPLLAALIINVVGGFIPIIGWLITIPIGNVAVLIMAILGIIKAAGGKIAALPLIGKFNLIEVK